VLQTTLLVALSLLGACSSEEWKLDVDVASGEALAIKRVVARRTVAVALGVGSASIDSSTPKNSVSVELLLQRGASFPAGGVLVHRTACLFDGKVWVSRWTQGAALQFSSEGTVSESVSFMPHTFAPGPPTACEVSVLAEAPGASAVRTPTAAGTVCWTAERGLAAGLCPATSLPRSSAAEEVVDVRLAWSGGLSLAAAVTLGATVISESDLGARAACEFEGGPPRQSAFNIVVPLRDLGPGETTLLQGTAFGADAARPKRCTVVVRRRPLPVVDASKHVALETVCFEGDAVRDGACEGLAPGAVTVRIDASRKATLERGAHREGPLEIGGEGRVDWTPVVRSVAAARDEAVILAAPRSMEHSAVVSLVQELAAAQLPVALSVAPP
jgi:hypothetical protein